MYSSRKECRWCGTSYYAKKPVNRDGFCSKAHKQAHYRAYKKYVTQNTRQTPGSQVKRVTRKKRGKKKCDTCSAKPNGCALWKKPNVQGCKRYLKKRKKRK